MKSLQDIRDFARRRFEAMHKAWLVDPTVTAWPLQRGLAPPAEKDILQDIGRFKQWADGWRTFGNRVTWGARAWRVMGEQQVPETFSFNNPHEVAQWAGQEVRWLRAVERHRALVARFPALPSVAARHFAVLADYSDQDYVRLVSMLDWLERHPTCNLYARQLPIPGLDSKWLEARPTIIRDMMAAILGTDETDFYKVCGLKPVPGLIRMRVLDPVLRQNCMGLSHLGLIEEEARDLPWRPETVLVVENRDTGLSFADRAGTVVILARGYGVEVLSGFEWVKGAPEVLYWGDIDTHGLAIMSRVRSRIPHMRPVLMDQEVLAHHAALDLVGVEDSPHPAGGLPNLTQSEQALFDSLRKADGTAVRLEQERIAWNWAVDRLKAVHGFKMT